MRRPEFLKLMQLSFPNSFEKHGFINLGPATSDPSPRTYGRSTWIVLPPGENGTVTPRRGHAALPPALRSYTDFLPADSLPADSLPADPLHSCRARRRCSDPQTARDSVTSCRC